MKVKDVPQNLDEGYSGQSKIRYARDDDGQMIKVPSIGWEVEKQITEHAWDDLDKQLLDTYKKVKRGELSPLAFHIEKKLLTPTLLAQSLGLWGLTVRRHLKPKAFAKLSDNQFKTYADFLEISVDELKTLPKEYRGIH